MGSDCVSCSAHIPISTSVLAFPRPLTYAHAGSRTRASLALMDALTSLAPESSLGDRVAATLSPTVTLLDMVFHGGEAPALVPATGDARAPMSYDQLRSRVAAAPAALRDTFLLTAHAATHPLVKCVTHNPAWTHSGPLVTHSVVPADSRPFRWWGCVFLTRPSLWWRCCR